MIFDGDSKDFRILAQQYQYCVDNKSYEICAKFHVKVWQIWLEKHQFRKFFETVLGRIGRTFLSNETLNLDKTLVENLKQFQIIFQIV